MNKLTLILLAALAGSRPVQAQFFENHANENTAVAIAHSTPVEIEARAELIKKATRIEIMTFVQSTGQDVGPHITLALLEAVRNGAKMRGFYDRFANAIAGVLIGDDYAKTLLSPESLAGGSTPELYRLRLETKKKLGLSVDDFFHEKIMILNRGTAHELVIVSTMNNSGNADGWIESSVYLRPLKPEERYLGSDIKAYVDKAFDFAKKNESPLPSGPSAQNEIATLEMRKTPLTKTPEERKRREELIRWATTPAAELANLNYDFAFFPKEAQLISNDLISQIQERFPNTTVPERSLLLQQEVEARGGELTSDTLAAVSRAALESRSGSISSYIIGFPKLLLRSVIAAVRGGSEIDLYSNGRTALAKTVPILGKVAYTISAQNLEQLFSATSAPGSLGGLHVHGLDAKESKRLAKLGARDARSYLHRKWATFGDTVFLGCDNLTESAALKNNEIMLRFLDPGIARYMIAQMKTEARYFRPIESRDIEKALKWRGPLRRTLDHLLRPLARRSF